MIGFLSIFLAIAGYGWWAEYQDLAFFGGLVIAIYAVLHLVVSVGLYAVDRWAP